ncbi:Cytochrome P450 2C6,Cytochrome P450 2C31,Cytochrome P450 2C15 [Mytilus coruscus]|uniref:Cytochrome P450 2C6,Cytochrome P450 2C31,Cytochrome P450 2C15 n=1 Tax=Mytilus coruscus TaxID=42192 RepID=A0A6J8AI86_MYTCO|nr:Cytochrome P450 2C6,Cytochrome P450 2C31,Cytochrome P450 2C15 [Mytilus coruscus]
MIDLSTAFLLFCGLGLYILWRKTTRNVKLPPGPPTTPFFGNLNVKLDNLPETFREYRLKYGDVFSLILGSKTMVVVNGLETLKEVFIKNGDITSDRPDMFIAKEIGHYKGIASSSGSRWKEHRTFTIGALREFGFGKRSLESKVMEEVEVLIKVIGEQNGTPFNIRGLLTLCVSNIMCSINFGQRYEHTDEFFMSLLEKINQNLGNSNVMFVATIFPFLKYIPYDPFGIKRNLRNADDVEKHLTLVIKEHEETYDENNLRDYVDIYLKRMKSERGSPESTFDHEQLLKTIGDLFVAGTETTSTAVQWFIVLLINHPEVQNLMRQEIRDVIGTSRYPCMEDRAKLPYTEAVLHEVLRFGCIGPLALPHGLTKDFNYKGSVIPKDSMLIPNLHSVLYDPEIFDEPEKFRPTRFLDTDRKLVNVDKVLVFSLGRRVCPGESLARMEFFLFTTSLVQRFKLLPSDPNHLPSTKGKLGITLAPEQFTFRAVEVESLNTL